VRLVQKQEAEFAVEGTSARRQDRRSETAAMEAVTSGPRRGRRSETAATESDDKSRNS
jgi:hypothetical protein